MAKVSSSSSSSSQGVRCWNDTAQKSAKVGYGETDETLYELEMGEIPKIIKTACDKSYAVIF